MSTTDQRRAGLAKAAEVADYLKTTPAHLANLRFLGTGPAFVKLGRSVRYRWSDVDAWVQANRQTKSAR
ncbi:AlpA family transcriptional regulator [Mycolicibacterium sp. OfavD-34-C]|uniref:helix-turn-helix transcriptional regulator n=1 Tax=Mycolicibacterium sp. OfavD-34-C TaxID=2917746 RepID=UPI001EF68D15|nr:helix-turn-helix domain-containing protein [Mycolicibacterium sp. OfavD-34-C]MCG7583671.1 helix-turn-helix domain-containing protein [Mycolicibacterium sp. OfavD-34-C]